MKTSKVKSEYPELSQWYFSFHFLLLHTSHPQQPTGKILIRCLYDFLIYIILF